MELWIRSQDKTILMKSPELRYEKRGDDHSILAYDTMEDFRIFGTYSTKERALEVLDEIQAYITTYLEVRGNISEADIAIKKEMLRYMGRSYQMPEE